MKIKSAKYRRQFANDAKKNRGSQASPRKISSEAKPENVTEPPVQWSDSYLLAKHPGDHFPYASGGRVHAFAEELAQRAEMPPPRIFEDPRTFFAAADCVQARGLLYINSSDLGKISDAALRGVLAHELSHIKTKDPLILYAVMLAVAAGYIVVRRTLTPDASSAGIMMGLLTAYTLSNLIRGSITRGKEYSADARALTLLENPEDMVVALTETAERQKLSLEPRAELPFFLNTRTHPHIGNRLHRIRAALNAPQVAADS